jgi:hypothetical protein
VGDGHVRSVLDEDVEEWMRTRKREGLGVGVRKQLIRPCTG